MWKMNITSDKQYVRIEAVLFVELKDGEGQEDAEDRFLESLPTGIDCASFHSEYWAE